MLINGGVKIIKEKSIDEKIRIKNIGEEGVLRIDDSLINIIQVEPINFKLKSISEQNFILESYKCFLKQCDFDFQIFIQTKKADVRKHIKEVENCSLYEAGIRDMVQSYIELINEISEVRGGISRRFFIVIKTKENEDYKNKILKIIEGLKECGNITKRCNQQDIIEIFQNYFKKTFQTNIACGS